MRETLNLIAEGQQKLLQDQQEMRRTLDTLLARWDSLPAIPGWSDGTSRLLTELGAALGASQEDQEQRLDELLARVVAQSQVLAAIKADTEWIRAEISQLNATSLRTLDMVEQIHTTVQQMAGDRVSEEDRAAAQRRLEALAHDLLETMPLDTIPDRAALPDGSRMLLILLANPYKKRCFSGNVPCHAIRDARDAHPSRGGCVAC
jgi:hypothetical protein